MKTLVKWFIEAWSCMKQDRANAVQFLVLAAIATVLWGYTLVGSITLEEALLYWFNHATSAFLKSLKETL